MSNTSNDNSPAREDPPLRELRRKSTVFTITAAANRWKLCAQGRKNIGPMAGKIEFERIFRNYKQEKPHIVLKALKEKLAKKPKERTEEDVLELCALTQLISTYFSKHVCTQPKLLLVTRDTEVMLGRL